MGSASCSSNFLIRVLPKRCRSLRFPATESVSTYHIQRQKFPAQSPSEEPSTHHVIATRKSLRLADEQRHRFILPETKKNVYSNDDWGTTTPSLNSGRVKSILITNDQIVHRCRRYISVSSACSAAAASPDQQQSNESESARKSASTSSEPRPKEDAAAAVEKKENVYTVPNALCIGRILVTPYIGYTIVAGNFPVAFGLFAIAGITDVADGWIARRWPSQSSDCGAVLDPLADKVLVVTIFTTLTYVNIIPLWLTATIILKDVLLIVVGCYIRYMALPAPKTLKRFVSPSIPVFQPTPSNISKLNTFFQLSLVASSLFARAFDVTAFDPILPYFQFLVFVTTWWSGLGYAMSNQAFRSKGIKTFWNAK